MARFLGRNWKKEELRARVGDIKAIAGIEQSVLEDGSARGLRQATMRTGNGLVIDVLLDRAMDLGSVSFQGMPLNFRSHIGPVHPAHYDAQEFGWLKAFGGGLLTTCGLQNVGVPCEENGFPYGLHGGVSATPASDISVFQGWRGDRYVFSISGKIREAANLGLFGPNLVLHRTIESELGSQKIKICDKIVNEGFTDSDLMLLYHINAGFPVVDDGARLLAPTLTVTPRDKASKPGLSTHNVFEAPQPGYAEQVFFHKMSPSEDGRVKVALQAPSRVGQEPLALCVDYPAAHLPEFIEWKMMGAGCYVVGLEPANCLVLGRAAERKRGTLQKLRPGQEVLINLEISVLNTQRQIDALEVGLEEQNSKPNNRKTTRRIRK